MKDLTQDISRWKKIAINYFKIFSCWQVVGGVIPKQDYAFLESIGVSHIFGPGRGRFMMWLDLLELLW